jgi:hypothetical protein
LIRASPHRLVVVAQSQLAECGETSQSHPNLELLVFRQIRNSCSIVGIAEDPIGWRRDLIWSIVCFLEQLRVAGPSDALVCHAESAGLLLSCFIGQHGAEDGIVEDRVRNESAGIDSLAIFQLERIAGAAVDGVIAESIATELRRVQRLDVSAVVLVEVREAIVEVDWRANVVRDRELQRTNRRIGDVDCAIRRPNRLNFSAPKRFRAVVGRRKRERDLAVGDLGELVGRSAVAICVVYL